jgi:anthranilate phosphoribosyltransferase
VVSEHEVPEFTVQDAIRIVVEGAYLTEEQAAAAMDGIMTGTASAAQIAALITGLRMRGETIDEMAGFARSLRRHVERVSVDDSAPLIDTCGTGGDGAGSFNISTTAAIVAAGAGVRVAKHGNRSVTSRCGSADVLEALGVIIDLPPASVEASIRDAGIGFMFAPRYHPGFRHAGPARKDIGIRTVFNLLGPMTNPAGARRQVIGVSVPAAASMIAEALARLESQRVLIVASSEGLDELGLGAENLIVEYDSAAGGSRQYSLSASDAGLRTAPVSDLAGGSAEDNARIVHEVLRGERGPRRDVVLLNAGAGLYAAGTVADISEGVRVAADAIDSGSAMRTLERFIEVSRNLAAEAEARA